MQNLINVSNVTFQNSEIIDSQQLLAMVNETRKEYGEKPIRNNDFIARIKDELEGEHYENFVVQKANNTESEVIEMTLKQALRVAARESKAVRRSLIDKLEQQSKPKSQAELNLAYALEQVEQERRLKSIENQVVQVVEEIENIKQGTLPPGYQGYSYLKSTYGLSDAKCRQLVIVWKVENKKVPHVIPNGQISQMAIVHEESFKNSLDDMMSEAEKRGSQWYHPKMGRFSITGWKSK